MVDQLLEAIANETVRHRLFQSGLLELEEETLAKILRANSRRIEALDGAEHLLPFLPRIERKVVGVAPRLFRRLRHHLVERANYILNSTSEIAVIVNVAYELVGEKCLPRSKLEQADLIAQMIAQITRGNSYRLEVFALLVLLAATTSGVEAIEEDLLPIDLTGSLVLGFRLRRLFGLALLLLLLIFRLDKVEKRIVQKLLLEMLLQVQQGHIEQIHRLVEAWIDL